MTLKVTRIITTDYPVPPNTYSTNQLTLMAYSIYEELVLDDYVTLHRWIKHRDKPVETNRDLDELFTMVLSSPNTTVDVETRSLVEN